IDRIRTLVQEGRTTYQGSPVEDDNLLQLAIYLLRLGLLNELIELRDRHALRLDPAISAFLDFCSDAYRASAEQGRSWRERNRDAELFTISGVVWGDAYVNNFMEFCLRSMLAPGNLPGVAQQGPCMIAITTNARGAASIHAHPAFRQASLNAQ